MIKITTREKEVLDMINWYFDQVQEYPSMVYVSERMGLSKQRIANILRNLARKGKLVQIGGSLRNYRVTDTEYIVTTEYDT